MASNTTTYDTLPASSAHGWVVTIPSSQVKPGSPARYTRKSDGVVREGTLTHVLGTGDKPGTTLALFVPTPREKDLSQLTKSELIAYMTKAGVTAADVSEA